MKSVGDGQGREFPAVSSSNRTGARINDQSWRHFIWESLVPLPTGNGQPIRPRLCFKKACVINLLISAIF